MSNIITLSGIHKRYGSKVVLHDLSLDIPRGGIFGLLGVNGAGKTTLFSIIAGFVRPDAGHLTINGCPPSGNGQVGILPQDALLRPDVAVGEQLCFFLRLSGYDATSAAQMARRGLERVGLRESWSALPGTLSHGMLKRVGLAQAFFADPPLVLLDEPTAGLDPANAALVRDLIRSAASREQTILISSHDLAEMQQLCHHVAVIDGGRVTNVSAIRDLVRTAQNTVLLLNRVLSDDELSACRVLLADGALNHDHTTQYTLKTTGDPDQAMLALLGYLVSRQVVPRHLDRSRALEQFFLAHTQTTTNSGSER